MQLLSFQLPLSLFVSERLVCLLHDVAIPDDCYNCCSVAFIFCTLSRSHRLVASGKLGKLHRN